MKPNDPQNSPRIGNSLRPPHRPSDSRMGEHGLIIITRLLATLRTGRAYHVGNQVFTKQLESFLESVLEVVKETGEAVFVMVGGDIFLNNTRVPFKSNNLRFHDSVRREFDKRGIVGLRATAGVDLKEAEVFLELFLQPEGYSGQSLVSACHARGNLYLLPVVHASAYLPDPDAVAGKGDDDAATMEGDTAGGSAEDSGPSWVLDHGSSSPALLLALQGMRALLHAPSDSGQLRHAKRVVQPLVDGAFASDPVVVGLSGLTHHDDYTYAHAVNVCLVAVNLGQVLGLDRRQLADLGVAVLLHDVGKGEVADEIEHPLAEFTAVEREAAERHPIEGAKLIARRTVLSQTTLRCIRVALEHHMSPDSRGYPLTITPWGPSLLSRITAAADCYVSLLTHRSQRGETMTPHEALSIMFGPLINRFDIAVLWGLVQVVGFYPPGQMVMLDDGSVAVSLANNPKDPARPHLRIVLHADGSWVRPDENLEFHPLPPERSVRRALWAEEYPGEQSAAGEARAA